MLRNDDGEFNKLAELTCIQELKAKISNSSEQEKLSYIYHYASFVENIYDLKSVLKSVDLKSWPFVVKCMAHAVNSYHDLFLIIELLHNKVRNNELQQEEMDDVSTKVLSVCQQHIKSWEEYLFLLHYLSQNACLKFIFQHKKDTNEEELNRRCREYLSCHDTGLAKMGVFSKDTTHDLSHPNKSANEKSYSHKIKSSG